MEEQSKSISDTDLIVRLKSLARETTGMTVDSFEALLKDMPQELSMAELNQIVNFASEQVGIWEAEYSFSPANSPNTDAKTEWKRWEALWDTWSDMLLKLVPDLLEQVQRRHRLIVAKHSVERSLQCTSTKPLRRVAAAALSKVAIGLGRLGIAGIPERLYAFSLYPKGSVGRSKI